MDLKVKSWTSHVWPVVVGAGLLATAIHSMGFRFKTDQAALHDALRDAPGAFSVMQLGDDRSSPAPQKLKDLLDRDLSKLD